MSIKSDAGLPDRKSKPFYESQFGQEREKYKVLGNSFFRAGKPIKKENTENIIEEYQTVDPDWTPQQIYEEFNKHVYGLDNYKRAVSVLIWKALNGYKPKGALLVVGQSGSGKTELLRVLEKIYPLMRVADGSSVIHSGYRNGEQGIKAPMYYLSTQRKAYPDLKPIFVIDEFDKLLDNNKGSNAKGNMDAIPELYRMIEGNKVTVQVNRDDGIRDFDTDDFIFIFTGSFASSTGNRSAAMGFTSDNSAHAKNSKVPTLDEVNKQLTPEMRGRIEDIIISEEFNKQDYINILNSNLYSPIKKIGKEYGVKITATEQFIDKMATEAYDSGVGVRLLNSAVMRRLNELLFKNPNVKSMKLK